MLFSQRGGFRLFGLDSEVNTARRDDIILPRSVCEAHDRLRGCSVGQERVGSDITAR